MVYYSNIAKSLIFDKTIYYICRTMKSIKV